MSSVTEKVPFPRVNDKEKQQKTFAPLVLTESACEQSSENSLKIVGNYWQEFFSTQLLHCWYGGKSSIFLVPQGHSVWIFPSSWTYVINNYVDVIKN